MYKETTLHGRLKERFVKIHLSLKKFEELCDVYTFYPSIALLLI